MSLGEGSGGGELWGWELAWRQRCLSPVFPAGLLLARVHWEQGIKRGQGPCDWWGWWPNPGRGGSRLGDGAPGLTSPRPGLSPIASWPPASGSHPSNPTDDNCASTMCTWEQPAEDGQAVRKGNVRTRKRRRGLRCQRQGAGVGRWGMRPSFLWGRRALILPTDGSRGHGLVLDPA